MLLDEQNTLHAFAKKGTGLLSERMIHHGQRSRRPLIRTTSRLFDPEFVSILWSFTTHIDQVGIFRDIISTMLNTVILLVVHDIKPSFVLIRKDLFALVKVSNKRKIILRDSISKIVFTYIKLELFRQI